MSLSSASWQWLGSSSASLGERYKKGRQVSDLFGWPWRAVQNLGYQNLGYQNLGYWGS
jgi:hypothetical protein